MKESANITTQNFPFKSNLLGEFNAYNCLAAASVCLSVGIDPLAIRAGLEDFTPPIGRTEIVYPSTSSGKTDFTVMIDFAHTPNSIENILQAVKKEMKPAGRIIHVFGSAGRRDPTKRPLMGKASALYAEIIILTAEDPRDEKIEQINQQISEGMKHTDVRLNNEQVFEIADRQEAIDKAIAIAEKGDVIVITGKGHEQSMNMGHGEVPWSDHEAVKKALEKRKKLSL